MLCLKVQNNILQKKGTVFSVRIYCDNNIIVFVKGVKDDQTWNIDKGMNAAWGIMCDVVRYE